MSDVIATIVTTGPNDFYHRLENEWRNVNPEMVSFFTLKGKEAERVIKTMSSGKGDLTVTMSAVIDGAPVPAVVIEKVSYGDLTKMQNWIRTDLVRDIFNIRDEWHKKTGKK